MKLKYIPVYAGNFDEQLKFYTDKLGFKICEDVTFDEGHAYTLIETGNYDVLLAISKNNLHVITGGCIILNTDDCLNDYHQLKNTGVDFCTEPNYLPAGLVAEFKDPGGNTFLLLEERDYNEL